MRQICLSAVGACSNRESAGCLVHTLKSFICACLIKGVGRRQRYKLTMNEHGKDSRLIKTMKLEGPRKVPYRQTRYGLAQHLSSVAQVVQGRYIHMGKYSCRAMC